MRLRTGGHGAKLWIVIVLHLHSTLPHLTLASTSRYNSVGAERQLTTTGRSLPQIFSSGMDRSKASTHVQTPASTVPSNTRHDTPTNSSVLNTSVSALKHSSTGHASGIQISRLTHSSDSFATFNLSERRAGTVPAKSDLPLIVHATRGNLQSSHSRVKSSTGATLRSPSQQATNPRPSIGVSQRHDTHTVVTNISVLNSSISILKHKSFKSGEHFCHLQGVCRLGDGTYLLPAWMEKLSPEIEQCGISNILYSTHHAASSLGTPVMVFKGLPRANINISDVYRDIDIIGGEPPRAEQHLLISDLTPLILLSDMFMRPSAYRNLIKASCFAESGQCEPNRIYPVSLNPALLVDSAVSEVKDYLWPKGVIRLLRNGFGGSLQVIDLQDVYGWKFRSQASCFKSLLVTKATVKSFKSSTMVPDNFLFRANSLSRVPVEKRMQPNRRRCDLKVLILNQFRKGHIRGANILERALEVLNKALFREYPNASVRSENIYFQNSSFHEQVGVMQEADIVVTAHSDSNANLAFLRPGTLFLELLPFGVKPDLYQSIANAYDIDYRHVHAQPDSELFSKCIAHYNKEAVEQSETLLSHWKAAAKEFVNFTNDSRTNEPSRYFLPEEEKDEYSDMRNIKDCATLQRVSVHIKHLAMTIMREALLQCGIRGEGRQKAVFSQAMLV